MGAPKASSHSLEALVKLHAKTPKTHKAAIRGLVWAISGDLECICCNSATPALLPADPLSAHSSHCAARGARRPARRSHGPHEAPWVAPASQLCGRRPALILKALQICRQKGKRAVSVPRAAESRGNNGGRVENRYPGTREWLFWPREGRGRVSGCGKTPTMHLPALEKSHFGRNVRN